MVVPSQSADMTQEQSAETMEIVVMAIDKFSASANYEVGLPHTHTHPNYPFHTMSLFGE